MHKQTLLNKKAKQLKKMFEEYRINPFAYLINDEKYYTVTYKRMEKLKGLAVISTKESNITQEEFVEAFTKLTFFVGLTHKIDVDGGGRISTNVQYVHSIINKLEGHLKKDHLHEKERSVSENVLSTFKQYSNMQENLVDIYNEYDRNIKMIIGETGYFTDDDIEETLNVLAHFDYTQYKQFSILFEVLEDVDYLLEEVSLKLNTDEVMFLKQFSSKNRGKLKKELDAVSYRPDQNEITEKEHKRTVKEEYTKNLKNLNHSTKKKIRNKGIDTTFL
ncbi:hypothetical protein [Pontibacillus salipaludis]|uniref:hypothetical protein n=1 Tax=Pontibacillus salipaludis TaxID=1697394 RepID=UPI0031EB277C